MRVLIVGCGYIGLPLAAELVCQGHQVTGLRRTRTAEADLRAAGITPCYVDITRPADLAALPASFDWIVNCVAASGSADEYHRTYLDGTRNLLAWLSASPPKKFVYTSSTSVYGQTDGSCVEETSAAEPGIETGRALVQTERVLLEAVRQQKFPAVILRLAGIYGPGRGYWLRQFLAGAARLEGDGSRVLNMIHRDDVAGAVVAALQRGQPGQIYNAADDEPVTQLMLFEWLAKTLGKPLPPAVLEDPGAARKRGLTSKRVSNRKLKFELGYQLKYATFREGFTAELQRTGELPVPPAPGRGPEFKE